MGRMSGMGGFFFNLKLPRLFCLSNRTTEREGKANKVTNGGIWIIRDKKNGSERKNMKKNITQGKTEKISANLR